jgi:hypothetical protein
MNRAVIEGMYVRYYLEHRKSNITDLHGREKKCVLFFHKPAAPLARQRLGALPTRSGSPRLAAIVACLAAPHRGRSQSLAATWHNRALPRKVPA